ncbi:hypothetical protein [Caldanaerobius polysaccharolyticus]|uniref:hypothetical protein n=1 Tax=Caldanaerobius polysaccharolyticus TaxID=44256 RepID=UPI0006918845|nr:hypothetical protein [Caldanaerobius polysaccharolyticus]
MTLKRALIIVLCVIFALSVFTACGSKQSSSGEKSSSAKSSQSDKITEIKLPIVKEPLTLTYWVPMDSKGAATMKDYGEIKAYQELEKRTGIHIKFLHPPIHPPIGQESDQFNLMMASNNLPDMIYYSWRTIPGGPGKALSDGSIIK